MTCCSYNTNCGCLAPGAAAEGPALHAGGDATWSDPLRQHLLIHRPREGGLRAQQPLDPYAAIYGPDSC